MNYVLDFLHGLPYLQVWCEWCAGSVRGGCLACLPYHRRLQELVAAPEWCRFRRAARADDPPPPGVVLDWLLEQGAEPRCPALGRDGAALPMLPDLEGD